MSGNLCHQGGGSTPNGKCHFKCPLFYPFPYVLYRCPARGQPFPVWDILNSKNCSISYELRDQHSIDRSVKSSNLVIELFHIIKVMGCYCSHVLSGKKSCVCCFFVFEPVLCTLCTPMSLLQLLWSLELRRILRKSRIQIGTCYIFFF